MGGGGGRWGGGEEGRLIKYDLMTINHILLQMPPWEISCIVKIMLRDECNAHTHNCKAMVLTFQERQECQIILQITQRDPRIQQYYLSSKMILPKIIQMTCDSSSLGAHRHLKSKRCISHSISPQENWVSYRYLRMHTRVHNATEFTCY